VAGTLDAGLRTRDLGGDLGTAEVAEAILEALARDA
jgi:isocitrate/isopropylmalate dehydrogenase